MQFIQGCHILADKGFIGTDWQTEISRTTGNRVSTAKRVNQHQQTPPVFERLLQHFRERIEGVFNEVQNTVRNLERLLRKKVEGLCVHVAAKMARRTLRILLRQRFGIDVLTFEQTPVQPFGQLTEGVNCLSESLNRPEKSTTKRGIIRSGREGTRFDCPSDSSRLTHLITE